MQKKRKKRLKIKNILVLVIIVVCLIFILKEVFKNKDFKVELETTVLNVGSEFVENFTATFKNKSVTEDVIVSHNIYNEKVGNYQVTFIYKSNGKEYKIVKDITIKDAEKPLIVLTKSNEITVLIDQKFVDPGYKATDNYDGDITKNVKVTGKVDMKKAGKYTLTYTVIDGSKNKFSIKRTVIVSKTSPLNMDLKDFTLDGVYDNTLLQTTEDKGEEYSGDFIIAGDSTALYYVMNKIITGARLWHKEGLTSETALTQDIYINHKTTDMTFVEAFVKNKPEKVLFTIGTNSVATMEIDYFIRKYKKLVEDMQLASPDTLLIIQSIPPVSAEWDLKKGTINNDKINKMNYHILEMCNELEVPFLNSAEALKDENGQLKAGYYRESTGEKGIHLSEEGNRVIMEYFETHAYIEE